MVSPHVTSTRKLCFIAAFLVILVGTCATSQARRWTDIDGNEVSAKFVRVNDGVVYLKKGTRVVEVPFDSFCEDDQEFIRGVVTKSNKEPVREWEDRKGRKTKATFVRLEDGKVILRRENKDKEIKVSLDSLSADDQEYVTKRMERRAAAELALKSSVSTDPSTASIANNPMSGSRSPSRRAGSSRMPSHDQIRAEADRRMKEAMAEHDRAIADMKRRSDTREFDRRIRDAKRDAKREADRRSKTRSEEIVSSSPPVTSPVYSSRSSPARHSFDRDSVDRGDADAPRFTRSQPSVSEAGYVCSQCNKRVPKGMGAGNNCPHCGVYFEFSEEADGTTTYAKDYGFRRLGWLALVVLSGVIRYVVRGIGRR